MSESMGIGESSERAPVPLMKRLRRSFGGREDFYDGGDVRNASRMGSLLWGLLVVLMAALVPLSPPDQSVIGEAGWAVAAVIAVAGALLVYVCRKTELLQSWDLLLAVAYGSVVGISLMQWLGGGVEPPYSLLLLLAVLFVGAVHPPKRVLVFLAFVAVALALPYLYDHFEGERAGSVAASFVIWCGLALLGGVLMNYLRSQRLTLSRGQQEAREEARLDPLTGLRNRRAFDEVSDFEIGRARRLGVPLSLILLDIDKFKQVNDSWGHIEGDRCLRDVAIAIRGEVRQPDLAFR